MKEWHYSRTDLAKHYVDKLDLGLSNNLAIFAPRRKGKSEFALMDFIPEAASRGYFPIYSSLWSDLDSPHKALIEDLTAYNNALNSKSKLAEILSAKVKKLTLNLYGIAKGEVEFPSNATGPTADDISVIRSLVTNIALKSKGDVILIIDEVQHLTTSNEFSGLSHAIRTLLDTVEGVKGVFTGSSRSGMSLLFGDKKSPFFQFALQENFPNLEVEFIRFLLTKAKDEYGLLASEKEFYKAFVKLDQSPYWAKKMLEMLIMKDAASVNEAMTSTLQIIVNVNQYESIAKSLNDVDKAVYLLAADKQSLFSAAAIEHISKQVTKSVTKSRIQKSVSKLLDKGYLSKMMNGGYEIELMGFSEWLRRS